MAKISERLLSTNMLREKRRDSFDPQRVNLLGEDSICLVNLLETPGVMTSCALHSGSCSQTPGKFKTMEALGACRDDCEYVNKSNKKPFRTSLKEGDIPGASLKGRKAKQLKNDELKCWLKRRGASVS